MIKRAFDVAVSLMVLVIGLPVLVAIGVGVRIGLGAPIFFRQERIGKNGRSFRMVKFRTMRDAYDADGRPLPDAERMTRLGSFLRKSSLDELPEIYNVLVGNMSLVGPRPLLPQYLERYTERQNRRHEVLPGVTGWAQINGRNAIDWDTRFELDVWYVENRSFWLDLKIVWLTGFRVLWPEGVNHGGHVTMPEFGVDQDRKTLKKAA